MWLTRDSCQIGNVSAKIPKEQWGRWVHLSTEIIMNVHVHADTGECLSYWAPFPIKSRSTLRILLIRVIKEVFFSHLIYNPYLSPLPAYLLLIGADIIQCAILSCLCICHLVPSLLPPESSVEHGILSSNRVPGLGIPPKLETLESQSRNLDLRQRDCS